jgi:aminoglycoside phosphotransferase (APT) family kinase protein
MCNNISMTVQLTPEDEARLGRWLDENVQAGVGEPLVVRPLTGGQANLTYQISRGATRLVLRRPPSGAPPDRNRAMRREFTLLGALAETDVPHARARGYCDNPTVLGACFYVMDFVDGWSPASLRRWPAPYDTDPLQRALLAYALVDGAAALARADWKAIGLRDFGRPDSFHERQVDRWLTQFETVRFRDLPGLEQAASWLRGNRPRSWQPGLMHGDYQFHNVMYEHGAPRLAAIVDWELSTIGDPLLDLAWILMSEDWNADIFDLSGMPDHDDLINRYAQASGRDVGDIAYYMVLARFKMAVIMEGVFARSLGDHQSELDVAHFGDIARGLAASAGAMVGRS